MRRHNFALARFIALTVPARAAGPQPGIDKVMLADDRHQSAAENHTVAFAYAALAACFLDAFLPLLAAVPLAFIAIQMPVCVLGLAFNNRRVNAAVYLLGGAAMACYLVRQPTWIRFGGYTFFAIIVLNAVAFVILLPLRERVE